nr:hypothetical protein [Tanacetum cinerariifolium]
MLSEAQGCDPANHLRRERDYKGCVPRSLSWQESLDRVENVGFDLVTCYLCPSFIEGYNAKGVGLRVADSIGNRREDDFTPLETIQRFLGVTGSRSLLSSKGRPSSRIGDEAFELNRKTCTLTKAELTKFLTDYGISSEYKVMLPKSNQTIYNAPDEFVGLYTHSFSLANLRLPLLKLFCDVLEYFRVHLSRLNPFGCAKLTTFVVMCKAYGGEPSVDLFRGFFNLYPSGEWLAFAKRPEEDVPTILEKPITQTAFRNFLFAEDDEEMTFLPSEPSPGFGCGSPSAFINNEPPLLEVDLLDSANPEQLVGNIADSRVLWQAVVNNVVNRRARELLKVVEKMKGECEVLKERERAKDRECEALRMKCKVAMADFDRNHAVNVLRQKIKSLLDEGKLEAVEALFCQEIEALKCDRAEVVSKEVANKKEPFDLAKVKGYRPTYKKEHTRDGNDLDTATFPFLSEVVADPSASVENLLTRSRSLSVAQLQQRLVLQLCQLLLRKLLHPLLLHQNLCLLP